MKRHPALRDTAIAAIALIVVLAIPFFHRARPSRTSSSA